MVKLFDIIYGYRLRKRNIFFRYSKDEQFTGEYWLDGKPIYCKTIIASTDSLNDKVTHGISNIGSYRTIDLNNSFWQVNEENFYQIGAIEGTPQSLISFISVFRIGLNNVQLSVAAPWQSSKVNCFLTIRYTKND